MKKYTDPEVKIVEFDDKDIVRTSGGTIGIGISDTPATGGGR